MPTGFEGHYTNKASSTREGEATFYRTSRFRLGARQDVILRDCFKDLLHPAVQNSTVADETTQRSKRAKRHAQFEPMLRSSPHLQQVLQGVATVAQMTLLEPVIQPNATPLASSGQQMPVGTSDSTTGRDAAEGSICVVNSHFFFHPRASHVRNIHTAAVMLEVQAFINDTLNGAASCTDSQQLTAATAAVTAASTSHSADKPASAASEPGSSQQPAMLFCGDLNSDLNDGPPGKACTPP